MNLIRKFDPWRSKICSCPEKYSLSPYTGCAHRCIYCYASSYIRDFYHPRAKKNYLKRLKRELGELERRSTISLSNSSDPYQSLEEKLGLMRETLQILREYDHRILIVTKSDLLLRDVDLFRDIQPVISFTLTTLQESLSRILEGGAPPPRRRLRAIELLSRHFPVVVRFDPLIYPLNTTEIPAVVKILKEKGVRQVITSTYKVKPDNFRRMASVFPQYKDLWRKLYFEEGQKIKGYFYLEEDLRRKLIEKVREEALRYGLGFSTCREGFSEWNTGNCDGSSFPPFSLT